MEFEGSASFMTPADFRNKRSKSWKLYEKRHYVPLAIPSILCAIQRIVLRYNKGGRSGASVVYALESLLQRCGIPQEPACATCKGTGFTPSEINKRPCPEGCIPKKFRVITKNNSS